MSQKKVTLVYSLKNTFVLKDSLLLKQMAFLTALKKSCNSQFLKIKSPNSIWKMYFQCVKYWCAMKYIKSLLILTSLLFGYSSHATHLMGGEIVAQQINGYQYQILMTVYRDTL